jgi:hypothetical protein
MREFIKIRTAKVALIVLLNGVYGAANSSVPIVSRDRFPLPVRMAVLEWYQETLAEDISLSKSYDKVSCPRETARVGEMLKRLVDKSNLDDLRKIDTPLVLSVWCQIPADYVNFQMDAGFLRVSSRLTVPVSVPSWHL